MRASFLMFFEYLAMMGVPVLLLALMVLEAAHAGTPAGRILLLLIGVGAVIYGAVALREVYIHGGGKRERAVRQRNEDG